MIQLNKRLDNPNKNRIAFISSYPSGICPIAIFTSRLVENMIPASYGVFEPVMIGVSSDLSRADSDRVDFVIRKEFRSDYMEAADFINSDQVDVVMLQHHFGLFGDQVESCIAGLLKRVEVPVITTLHDVPENPAVSHYQNLTEVCDVSEKVIVMNRRDLEVLNRQYGVSLCKIDQIVHSESDNPFEQHMEWFHVGCQYWRVICEQLVQPVECSGVLPVTESMNSCTV